MIETLPAIGLVQRMNVSRVDAGSTSVPSGDVPVITQASGVSASRWTGSPCQQICDVPTSGSAYPYVVYVLASCCVETGASPYIHTPSWP